MVSERVSERVLRRTGPEFACLGEEAAGPLRSVLPASAGPGQPTLNFARLQNLTFAGVSPPLLSVSGTVY